MKMYLRCASYYISQLRILFGSSWGRKAILFNKVNETINTFDKLTFNVLVIVSVVLRISLSLLNV